MELARTELRVKNAYIDNLKVYEGIVNGYVLRLRERLEGFEPGCRLLEYRIPAMPAAGKSGKDESVETSKPTSDLEYVALSEIVDGAACLFVDNADFRIAGRRDHGTRYP
jgi:hypothetical protein